MMAKSPQKICTECGETKGIESFRVRHCAGRKDSISGYCFDCENVKARAAVAKKKDDPAWRHGRRMTQLKTKYRLSKEQYINMMLDQDFKCPICIKPIHADAWFVDHDHACCPGEKSCGECVRKLLCQKCNTLLGQAEDSVATLARAQAYLEVYDNA